MQKNIFLILIVFFTLLAYSCKQSNSISNQTNKKQAISSTVMTKQMQDVLTPDAILEDLLNGNQRYISGEMKKRDLLAQVSSTTKG